MKNLKLNKLAENKLNEKEIQSLTGGSLPGTWEYRIVCSAKEWVCCEALCSCTLVNLQYWLWNTASTGNSVATSNQVAPLPV